VLANFAALLASSQQCLRCCHFTCNRTCSHKGRTSCVTYINVTSERRCRPIAMPPTTGSKPHRKSPY
jgi:hypothetical protein